MPDSTESTSGVPARPAKMLDKIIHSTQIQTPALVYELEKIQTRLGLLQTLRLEQEMNLLYSIKSASFSALLEHMLPYIDGFSVSSLYEARFIADQFASSHTIHMTSPGIGSDEIEKLSHYCDAISVNSLAQWQCLRELESIDCSAGIRLNPHTQFGLDERYDPCRQHSKLGVSSYEFLKAFETDPQAFANLRGLHVHNNCQSHDIGEMRQTLTAMQTVIETVEFPLQWLNLGGGYLFNDEESVSELQAALSICEYLNTQVIIEPGKGIVGDAGVLVSTVTDVFSSDGKQIAIVDTTVNHLPEVFEYQYQPAIANEESDSGVEYRIAGMSCLSGDIFGDYKLMRKPVRGDRIVFRDVGAYMYVKANMFNGIPLPSVYLMHPNGELECIKEPCYEDYLRQLS